MEAVRPKHDGQNGLATIRSDVHLDEHADEVDALPPAPAPFPVHLIAQSSRTPVDDAHASSSQSATLTAGGARAEISSNALPPAYADHRNHLDVDVHDADDLPSYRARLSAETDRLPHSDSAEKRPGADGNGESSAHVDPNAGASAGDEKSRMELDDVSNAIERLYAVAPQLANQRSQLRDAREGSSSHGQTARERLERDKWRELEEIWEKIERAHKRGREAREQRAEREGWNERRTNRREKLIDELVQSANARLPAQDAEQLGSTEEMRLHRLQMFAEGVLERSRVARMDTQDYPQSAEERVLERREELVDDILRFSSSGKMLDQESLPPTPQVERVDPMEMVTYQEFLRTRPSEPATGTNGNKSRSRSSSQGQLEEKNGFATKFKSMVRRSSVSLGFKSNASFDMSNLSYVAEHQENLNIVQIMLHGPNLATQTDLAIETSANPFDDARCQALVVSRKDPAVSCAIDLPVAVHPGQSAGLVTQSLHLEAKLSAIPLEQKSEHIGINTVLRHALSAEEMRRLDPVALTCAACGQHVVDTSGVPNPEGWKNLPSEHWAEMIEVWMCHQDPKWTSDLAEKTKRGLWPTAQTVLLGGSYILVRPNIVDTDSFKVDKGRVMGWDRVQCSCGAVLGQQKVDDGQPGAGTLKLDKWAMGVKAQGEGSITRYPLPVFILSDLLALSAAHASYRFHISDERSPRLLLWIFNPSVRIAYRKGSSSVPPSPSKTLAKATSPEPALPTEAKVLRAAKIMYRILGSPDLRSNGNGDSHAPPGFGEGGQVESLTYSTEVCDELIRSLRESSSAYPLGRRTMGVFDVGFLPRYVD